MKKPAWLDFLLSMTPLGKNDSPGSKRFDPTTAEPKVTGTTAEVIERLTAEPLFGDMTAPLVEALRRSCSKRPTKVFETEMGPFVFHTGAGCGECQTCKDWLASFFGESSAQEDEPPVDWRKVRKSFNSGEPIEVDDEAGVIGALGLQSYYRVRAEAAASGRDFKNALIEELGRVVFALTQTTAEKMTLEGYSSLLGKALDVAGGDYDDLRERIMNARRSVYSADREYFSKDDVLSALSRVVKGLGEGQTYFPEQGPSEAEQRLEHLSSLQDRFMRAEALLRELGETGVAGVIAQLLSGEGDPTVIIREKFAGAEVTLHDGLLGAEPATE